LLKTRDGPVEAQNFRGECVLRAKLLRSRDPPLPFVVRHRPIIRPRFPGRNAGLPKVLCGGGAQTPPSRKEGTRNGGATRVIFPANFQLILALVQND
jgi:hypothetical protein